MKELIEQITAYLPKYFLECGELLSGPKTFIVPKVVDNDLSENNDPYIFAAITIILATLLSILYPSHKEIYTSLVSLFVIFLVELTLMSLAVLAGWRVVGVRTPFPKILTIYIYIVGPVILITCILQLVGWGVFRLMDPQAYSALLRTDDLGRRGMIINNSNAQAAVYISLGIGFIMSAVYGFISWGSFRQLNKVDRLRSFGAFLLAGIFSIPLMGLMFMLVAAVS